MEIIDSHTHLQFRGREEIKSLVARGYTAAVACAFYPIVPRGPDTVLDMFDLLLKRYSGDVEGLKLFVALGIHPRSIPQNGAEQVLRELPAYLKKENVVALGEVGLETGAPEEVLILEQQLSIARDTGAKVILHTPKKDKEPIFEKELQLLKKSGIDPSHVIIDHNNEDTLDKVLKGGFYAGLTVSKGKMDAATAAKAICYYEDYSDFFLLNTDLGYSSDYLFDLVDATKIMERDLGPFLLRKAVHDNAKRFFNI